MLRDVEVQGTGEGDGPTGARGLVERAQRGRGHSDVLAAVAVRGGERDVVAAVEADAESVRRGHLAARADLQPQSGRPSRLLPLLVEVGARGEAGHTHDDVGAPPYLLAVPGGRGDGHLRLVTRLAPACRAQLERVHGPGRGADAVRARDGLLRAALGTAVLAQLTDVGDTGELPGVDPDADPLLPLPLPRADREAEARLLPIPVPAPLRQIPRALRPDERHRVLTRLRRRHGGRQLRQGKGGTGERGAQHRARGMYPGSYSHTEYDPPSAHAVPQGV